jgi:hypothetical protein
MLGSIRSRWWLHPLFVLVPMLVAAGARAQPAPAPAPEGQVMMTPPPENAGPVPGAPTPPPAVPPPAPPPPVSPVTGAAATETPEKKPPAGWLPGTGFVIQSEDAAYRLRIGLQAAYKFEPVYQNGVWADRNTFFVLRPILSGNFLRDWIHFWTSFEFASNPPYLLDSYIELFPWKEFGLRIGQQFTPYDRHEYFGPQEILFPEWAPVSEYFWPGRDKGVTAMGVLAEQLEYWAGIYSGTPLRQFNALPGNYVLEGRLTWSPLGPVGGTEFPYIVSEGPAPVRVSATIQGYYGRVQSAIENFNPSTFTFQAMPSGERVKEGAGGADFWLQGPWFMLYVDATIRRTTPEMGTAYTSAGVWGQFGAMFVPKTMDAAIRVNWLNPSTSLSNDQFYDVEGQVAYYASHSQHLVVKLRYAYGHQDSPGMTALGAVPLVISVPGRTQLATLQLNLAF